MTLFVHLHKQKMHVLRIVIILNQIIPLFIYAYVNMNV